MDNKVYFNPGDFVKLNKDLPNKPDKMLVVKKKTLTTVVTERTNRLLGLECIWFDSNGTLNKEVFSTKDLEIVK